MTLILVVLVCVLFICLVIHLRSTPESFANSTQRAMIIFMSDLPGCSEEQSLDCGTSETTPESKTDTDLTADTTASTSKLHCVTEPNMDYYQNTYSTNMVDSAEQCCQLCLGDQPKCKSWTFDTAEQICRLKSVKRSNVTRCPSRISGYVST